MEQRTQQMLSRRTLLRGAGLLGAAMAGGPLLSACSTEPGGGSDSSALRMMAWDFQPDTIKRLAKQFGKREGLDVEVQIAPNLGYSAAIQTRMQGGGSMDAFYNFTYNSVKFYDNGWAVALDEQDGHEEMLERMMPSARPLYLAPDGKMIGTPYYTATHMFMYNKEHLQEAGFSAPPSSLQEIYDFSKKMKSSGISASPYTGYWVKQFLEEYFMAYLLAEGITPFDDSGAPAFADDPKTVGMLEWWQTMYTEGLTQKSILTDDANKSSLLMAQGDASFLQMHHYFLKLVREQDGPEASNVIPMYTLPGSNGATVMVGDMIQMGETDNPDAAWELMRYFGDISQDGQMPGLLEWAKAASLAAPYPEFFKSEEIRGVFGDYYDMDQLLSSFEDTAVVVPTRNQPWYNEFLTKVGDEIESLLSGGSSAADTVRTLADTANTLAKD